MHRNHERTDGAPSKSTGFHRCTNVQRECHRKPRPIAGDATSRWDIDALVHGTHVVITTHERRGERCPDDRCELGLRGLFASESDCQDSVQLDECHRYDGTWAQAIAAPEVMVFTSNGEKFTGVGRDFTRDNDPRDP
jgi:hypothetical protein